MFHSYYSGGEMQGCIYIMHAVTVTLDVYIKTIFPQQIKNLTSFKHNTGKTINI